MHHLITQELAQTVSLNQAFSVVVFLLTGLQREDTIDSLDMYENDDDEDKISYPVADPAGFGFTQSMELDDPPKYEITPSIEGTRTMSSVVVRFQQSSRDKSGRGLEFDNIGYRDEDEEDEDMGRNGHRRENEDDERQKGKDKQKQKPRLSTKERRAQFQALKVSKTSEHIRENVKSRSSSSSSRTDTHSRNSHRKVERLSKSRDRTKTVVRQERVRTIHVEVENEDILLTVSKHGSPSKRHNGDKPRKTSKSSQSGDIKSKHKSKDKRQQDGADLSKKTTGTNHRNSGSANDSASSALRSIRFDAIRDKMLLEMSSVGSTELYDIPEDPMEDSMDSGSNPVFFDSSMTSETDVQVSGESTRLEDLGDDKKLKTTDSQETIPLGASTDDNDSKSGKRNLNFQFSLPESDVGEDFSFPILGSIDTGDNVPLTLEMEEDEAKSNDANTNSKMHGNHGNHSYQNNNNNKPGSIYSSGSDLSDSTSSSKSSAKEMREIYKNSRIGNALLNTLHTDAADEQRGIVYL